MSGFGVVSLTDLPSTGSEGTTNSYEYHHYCSPIYSSHQTIYRHQAHMPDIHSDTHSGCPEDNSFWSNSPRSDSPSPGTGSGNYVDALTPPHVQQHGYYQLYTQLPFNTADLQLSTTYKNENGYMDPLGSVPMDELSRSHGHIPGTMVRGVKRRNTANKKERRRTQSINAAFQDLRDRIPNVPADTKLSKLPKTQSINAAFQDLRDRIPNVPADTKLSKIKTLRLATSYISYLTGVLETDEPVAGFRAELAGGGVHSGRRAAAAARENGQAMPIDCSAPQGRGSPIKHMDTSVEDGSSPVLGSIRKAKGRTGWPQHVWALELKQEQNL